MFTMDQNPDQNPAEERGKSAPDHHFYLDIITQAGQRKRIPLPQTELVIGRSPNRCDLVIDDSRISRVHLRVSRGPDKGITVTDLYSANGTQFDGRQLEPGVPITWLINQTAVIGDCRVTLRYGNMETKRLGESSSG